MSPAEGLYITVKASLLCLSASAKGADRSMLALLLDFIAACGELMLVKIALPLSGLADGNRSALADPTQVISSGKVGKLRLVENGVQQR